MTQPPKVIIQILHFKSINDTFECLNSIFKLEYPNFTILVIDNSGNNVKSEPELDKLYREGRIDLIKTNENLGFAGGHNLGFQFSIKRNADYIWVLNNDCIVLPDTLNNLVFDMESDLRIGAISPIIYYYNTNKIQSLAAIFDVSNKKYTATHSFKQLETWEKEGRVFSLWGTAMLLRASILNKVGGFDESFFAYCEDGDLSWRISKHSFINRISQKAIVYHKDDIQLKKSTLRQPHYYFYMSRNEFLFLKKHCSLLQLIPAIRHYLINTLSRLSHCMTHGDMVCANATVDGLWCGLLGYGGPWRNEVHMPKFLARLLKIYSWKLYRLLSFRFK